MRYPFEILVAACAFLSAGCLEDNQNLSGIGTGGSAGNDSGGQGGTSQGGTGQGGTGQGGAGQGGGGGGGDGVHFARFGFRNGQQLVGDLCAAYGKTGGGEYQWASTGVLAASGLSASDYEGLEKLTAYLPLEGEPVAFGFTSPGKSCATGSIQQATEVLPQWATYYTVLAVPYSGEPTVVWVVGDPVEHNQGIDSPPGLRVVNAILSSNPIEIATTVVDGPPVPQGTLEFANSPADYTEVGFDHLWKLHATEMAVGPVPVTFDFVGIDLLPLQPRVTIFVSGSFQGTSTALACMDTTATFVGPPPSAVCFLVNGS